MYLVLLIFSQHNNCEVVFVCVCVGGGTVSRERGVPVVQFLSL
jgi:hypothetical protein